MKTESAWRVYYACCERCALAHSLTHSQTQHLRLSAKWGLVRVHTVAKTDICVVSLLRYRRPHYADFTLQRLFWDLLEHKVCTMLSLTLFNVLLSYNIWKTLIFRIMCSHNWSCIFSRFRDNRPQASIPVHINTGITGNTGITSEYRKIQYTQWAIKTCP